MNVPKRKLCTLLYTGFSGRGSATPALRPGYFKARIRCILSYVLHAPLRGKFHAPLTVITLVGLLFIVSASRTQGLLFISSSVEDYNLDSQS